ncbi:hypothetical protein ALC56_06355, partial [Trachymyrmex septentrionalis]
IEVAFDISRVTTNETKFWYVVVNLEHSVLSIVADILTHPSPEGKYLATKNRIITMFKETNESRLRKLLRGHEIRDDKLSVFLQRLRHLAGARCNDSVLHMLRTTFREYQSDASHVRRGFIQVDSTS